MFNMDKFKQHNFHDGLITECQNSETYSIIRGEFPEDETEISGCVYFYFRFNLADPKLPEMEKYTDIITFDIWEKGEEGYFVRICAEHKGFILAEFDCKDIFFERLKYEGMSYQNIYGTDKYNAYVESQKYVLDKEYFTGKEQIALPDGFALEVENYSDMKNMGTYSVNKAFLQKCAIAKNGQTVYEYLCTYRHITFHEFICHSNGHRYYPFHIDLYGISYLDVDTLDVYNYIPEGYQHDSDSMLGESFLITDIHYDWDSGLVAYGGCYWAGPPNVMIGDFSCLSNCGYPLEDMQNLIDPDYDQYEELDFESWDRGKLWLKCGKLSVSVDIDEIKNKLIK